MESSVTAFIAGKEIISGDSEMVARVIREQFAEQDGTVLVFDDRSGRITDLDYRKAVVRGVGRPKLGVQSREITLLPRQWEWLSEQPGGASAAIRRLVDEARRRGGTARERQDAVYRFMQAACGDLPGYDEALRALYAGRWGEFQGHVAQWPSDLGRYIDKLLNVGTNETAGPVA